MEAPSADVSRILTFGREKLGRKLLLYGLGIAAFGVLFILVGEDSELAFAGWIVLVIGLGVAGWEFSKTTQPQKPLLVLSPEGLRMRVEGAKEFFIPWSEVRGVDSITISGPRGTTFDNVTVVLVSREFYDRVIHVDSLLRRGPGWNLTFIPVDTMMQVALHHEILPVTAADLLAAVEARWRAFGARPTAEPRPG
jgi:hypothetical protein